MLYPDQKNILEDKVAVVTGGAKGIGKSICLKLSNCGAKIALIYNGSEKAAQETKAEIEKTGGRCDIFQCNVADYMTVKDIAAKINEVFGSVDILVNNAGITIDKLLIQMNEDDFDKVIDTNLKGTYNFIRHICPIMVKKRRGKIINISSVSGLMGNIGQTNYSASKAGLIGLSKSIAKEYAHRNITCNVIAPGFIETDMTDKLSDYVKEQVVASIPLKRMGIPEDIANMTVFLSSHYADYITGEIIKIDGGIYI